MIRLSKLKKLPVADVLAAIRKKKERVNDVWKASYEAQIAHIEAAQAAHPGDTRPTILIDEPDKSLSLDMQNNVLAFLVDKLVKDWQVIITSHSAFALGALQAKTLDTIRFIDLGGTAKADFELLRKLFA